MKQFLLFLWELAEMVIIAGVTVFIIRTFLAQPFLVSGASMSENFKSGDYLVVDELTYQFEKPERGDVVVFRYPGDPKTFYIKRAVGLPSERVTIKGGYVFINEKKIQESYLTSDTQTFGDVDLLLKEDEYFVLGDNRNHSFDSRSWGPLMRTNIVGLARLRLFPVNAIGILERPAYNR